MTTTVYHPFAPHRPLAQYRGQPGNEVNGQALSLMAYDALADSMASGKPCELVVIGEYVIDGLRYLAYGATPAYIEATTEYRSVSGRLRLVCPECEEKDGRHLRSCDRR